MKINGEKCFKSYKKARTHWVDGCLEEWVDPALGHFDDGRGLWFENVQSAKRAGCIDAMNDDGFIVFER